MANLKDIRNRIKSVKSIQQVTGAMKMVAAAKMRRAQENMERARPYSSRLSEILDSLLPEVDRTLMEELKVRPIRKKLFVVITADRGMAGAFNANVLKEAHKSIDEFGKNNSNIICIGKKAHSYFKNRGYESIKNYIDFWNELSYEYAIDIGRNMVDLFIKKEVDQVQVIYNKFINVAKQEIKNDIFLC